MSSFSLFFFFNDTATTEIYTLSLHDALPILAPVIPALNDSEIERILDAAAHAGVREAAYVLLRLRSEEHTSELQSRSDLVCRLLLEKKKNNTPASVHACKTRELGRSHAQRYV